MKSGKYHVSASNSVVWIHDRDGQCVARFNKLAGEILSKHGYTVRTSRLSWEKWKRDAKEEFGIEIPDEMRPK